MSWPTRTSVLVPIDFSDASFEALEEALSMVAHAADVHVLHVVPDLHGDASFMRNATDARGREALAEEELTRHLEATNHTDVDMVIRAGSAGEVIAEVADELACDLIVIPSRGRKGVSRVLLGSVAERVLRISRISVLVLRNKQ